MPAEHYRLRASEGSFGLPNGSSIRIRKEDKPRPTPGGTAEHEAAHVVASPGIQEATIIRRGNALGTTIPTRMTVGAAGAAAAMGHGGVGHDLRVAADFGASEGGAIAAGHAALAGKHDLVHEVAVTLQEEKTIGQHHVDRAKERVEKRRLGIYVVEIEIRSPHGEIEIRHEETFRGEVSVSSPWLQSHEYDQQPHDPLDQEKQEGVKEDEERLAKIRKDLADYVELYKVKTQRVTSWMLQSKTQLSLQTTLKS